MAYRKIIGPKPTHCACGEPVCAHRIGMCSKCDNKDKYHRDPEASRTRQLLHRKKHAERVTQQKLSRYRKLKLEVFAAYGNKCMCCEEGIQEFLSIDHINNDGAEHRRSLFSGKAGSTPQLYAWLKRNGFPKENFQLLCMNCNHAKSRCGGICPHKFLVEVK